MKKLLVYSLAAMLALPVLGSEPAPVIKKAGESRTELSSASLFGKKKKKGKKKKRKDIYRPGARQN